MLIVITVLIAVCSFPDELPPDQQTWEYDLPSRHQMDERQLFLVDDSITARSYGNVNSLMILKNDKIIYEKYYFDQNGRLPTRSAIDLGRLTLLVTGVAIGIAIEDGLIDSISAPIYLYLDDHSDLFDEDPEKKEITIENLLVHKSGFAWNETSRSYLDPRNNLNQMNGETDWTRFVLRQPLGSAPGTVTGYNSGSGMILSSIISSVTGISMEEYLKEKLFEPLEITEWFWRADFTGITNGANGLNLSMFDLTKIASVYLNGGSWEGRFIMDPDWSIDATIPQNVFSNFRNYGWLWWTFADNYAPNNILSINDAYFFQNENGDHVYIIPHQNMIVSIGGENFFSNFFNPSLFLYFDVLRAVQ